MDAAIDVIADPHWRLLHCYRDGFMQVNRLRRSPEHKRTPQVIMAAWQVPSAVAAIVTGAGRRSACAG